MIGAQYMVPVDKADDAKFNAVAYEMATRALQRCAEDKGGCIGPIQHESVRQWVRPGPGDDWKEQEVVVHILTAKVID